jgi:hypothetical protein
LESGKGRWGIAGTSQKNGEEVVRKSRERENWTDEKIDETAILKNEKDEKVRKEDQLRGGADGKRSGGKNDVKSLKIGKRDACTKDDTKRDQKNERE